MADSAQAITLLQPDWATPATVESCFTTRRGGSSAVPFDDNNLALHVGDDPAAVTRNRARLRAELRLDHEPCWLQQVHGTTVFRAAPGIETPRADAVITTTPGLACVVMVADCVPVLLCAADGREVAAVHAGWRGLHAGIIAAAVAAFSAEAHELRAWIGPHVGAAAYEVGNEVHAAFEDAAAAAGCFAPKGKRWLFDLGRATRQALTLAGVDKISDAGTCVYADRDRFYSYRRDGVTGRQAALIWITDSASNAGNA